MKNLSAFPRFPLSEALMILITLVVCLAGFTKAEVDKNYKKQDSSLQKNENFFLKEASFMKNLPITRRAAEMRGRELRGKHFFNLKNFPQSFFDRPIKRQLDYLGDSNESDSEKENDGYGYDDDEYYHFNYKRNDEPDKKIDSNKSEKEGLSDSKQKNVNIIPSNDNNQGDNNPAENNQPDISQGNQKNEDNSETIEMLNYKESHPVISQEDPLNPFHSSKAVSDDMPHSKVPSTKSIPTLTGMDFKENPAINDNSKDRKEESVAVAASDSKNSESKKEVKATDEKEPSKIQGSKLGEDSEKKEKDATLKDDKDTVAAKSLKDDPKTSEGKEKTEKLNDDAKLKDNIEKISNSKTKDSDSTKLTKEDKESVRFTDKISSDLINANGLSQISSGASFVGNDYKDNLDVLKSIRSEGDQKGFEETLDIEKNVALGEYQKDFRDKERQIGLLKNERARNYDYLNRQSGLMKVLQGSGKSTSYPKAPSPFDFQSSNAYFKRREPWRDQDKISSKFTQDYQVGQQLQHQFKQDQQQQLDGSLDYQIKHPLNSMPPNDLENTEYHKNYIKSLKKYKAQTESARNSTSDTGLSSEIDSASLHTKTDTKKKRSKPKRRRSMMLEKNSEDLGEDKIKHQKRKTYNDNDFLSNPMEDFLKKPSGSQTLNENNGNKEETNILGDKKYFDQWRQRRKSPQKLEYEIKIINQRQPDLKNAKFSHFNSNRLKKESKAKLSTEDKYLKKYPYSQVSRDDLMKLSGVDALESDKKYKRKASVWKRDDQKSVIQTRAVPNGYYSNRVKFGQKSFPKNIDKMNPDSAADDLNRLSQTYFGQSPSTKQNVLQRAWESKRPNYKHEPSKRFDNSQQSTMGNPSNSLLLVKKNDRMPKIFQEENPSRSSSESDLSPSQLAKILSEDKNYVVFKKADSDKLRKNSEPFSLNLNELGGSLENHKSRFLDSSPELTSNDGWGTPLKTLNTRSSHSDKNDKKLHGLGANSNLKKAIEKFRDMADFFKDSEQETTDNRYSSQEAKEKPDVVFSQDKLPDPIIISNDESNKESGFKQEPVNSIFAISNNFKNLDQQSKKVEFPGSKGQLMDSTWKPALKQAFPEAKSINSVVKNGNEIIVLDLNGNQLKREHDHNAFKSLSKDQPHGAGGASSRLYLVSPSQFSPSKKQDVALSDSQSIPQLTSGIQLINQDQLANQNKINLLSNERAVAIIRSADDQSRMPGSLHELAELPDLLKKIMVKVPYQTEPSVKQVNRKSLNEISQNELPQNYNTFPKNFDKMSEVSIKKDILLSPKSYPEQSTYNELNMKNLESILQSLLSPDNRHFNELNIDTTKNLIGNQKLDQKYQTLVDYQPDASMKHQNRWSVQEKNNEFIPFTSGIWESGFKTGEDIKNIIQLDGTSVRDNNENKLRKELAETSEKIHRLRREGAEAGKLRKTIEDALAFKEKSGFDQPKEFSNLNEENENKKYSSETVNGKPDDKLSLAEEAESAESLKCEPKGAEEGKEGSALEKSSKSDYENHLSELFENLNANKNQKTPHDNTWTKKKRMESKRRKRSLKRDISNKVSKTEVQNKNVKNLAEDNYPSVYSPGIRRKLLSTNNEIRESESEGNEHKQLDNFDAWKNQDEDIKNGQEKCVDPAIVKLFSIDGKKEVEKNRARRSLTSQFHSNFKREIDLDESMPNDFQSFLVTSLGSFGSQKEVVKKGEAFWEGREMGQDNYNQIAEGGKDSALEKREAPSNENHKSQKYKSSDYYSTENQELNLSDRSRTVKRSNKNVRSDDAALMKSKTSQYNDEKLPTQIRIQISNTSLKEKKSSKPIMDENETTSTEMENLPKEKEFFDKNKINPLSSRNYIKHAGPTYSNNEYKELSKNTGFKRKPPHSSLLEERIIKKSILESPLKSASDFGSFDQRAIESLLKNQRSNHDAEQLAQKISMITQLPQVETVYNPTQGGNKAQIENSRFAKTNSVKNKNSLNPKNNFKPNEGLTYDEGLLKSHWKTDEVKSDKGRAKEFGDLDWKLYNEKMNLEHEPYGASPTAWKSHLEGSASFSDSNVAPLNFNNLNNLRQGLNNQKWSQTPSNNYLSQAPSSVLNSPVMYDVMKLKQHMKNRNSLEKENSILKQYPKPIYNNENEIQDNPQKSKISYPSYSHWLDSPSNNLDFSMGKKPLGDYPENKNFENYGLKTQNPKDFGSFKPNFMDGAYSKNLYEKSSVLDSPQMNPFDNSKDADYMENLEDEYPEAEPNREPPSDEGLYKVPLQDSIKPLNYRPYYNFKKYKPGYKTSEMNYKNTEGNKNFDDEYEENLEDEDLGGDYSQFEYKKELQPEMMKFSPSSPKLHENFFRDFNDNYYNNYMTNLRGTEEAKFNTNPQNNFASAIDNIQSGGSFISGSDDLLRRANARADIFGKNLMRKLYSTSKDELYNNIDKFQNERSSEETFNLSGNRLSKRKLNFPGDLKAQYEVPAIGNRIFYASKVEVSDAKDLDPAGSTLFIPGAKRLYRRSYNRQLERNPYNAEFTGGENVFDHENKEHGLHFSDNFVDLRKRGIEQSDKTFSDKKTPDDESVEDIEENLEDGVEDNVLENVIGKYIMRKRIKSRADSNEDPEKEIKLKDPDSTSSGGLTEHKVKKRSLEILEFDQTPKVVKKRLSSGHLTENNYRKYHKKNLTTKRHITDLLSAPYSFTAALDDEENSVKKEEGKDHKKRSALDLFRKITNKEKDKRVDNGEGRTAGFEPLLSISEKSSGFIKEPREPVSLQEKQLLRDGCQVELRGSPPELKAHYPNEGQRLRAQLTDRKKGRVKEVDQVSPTLNSQGPWKVELNDKYDRPNLRKENNPKALKEIEKTPINNHSGQYKAFLVISNNDNALEQTSKTGYPSSSRLFHRETSSSYGPKSDECIRFSTNHVKKRSLKSTINLNELNGKDILKTSESLITRGSEKEKLQAPQVVQRSTKKNRSFATTPEENRDSNFFSKGKSNINRKSVFPPSCDGNIIRDSRHVNEEASEYHGQRIVDAILSQVSENSKFKELIAPGLAMRAPAKEGIDSKSKVTPDMNFSEELQSFLRKFMLGLEDLAEQHVKKKMCNEIDEDLKQFLQSLLSTPAGNIKDAVVNVQEENCSLSPQIDMPKRKNSSEIHQNLHESKKTVLDDLRKNQLIMKKLLENYHNLSKENKEALHLSYLHLLQELEQVNRKLKSLNSEPPLIPISTYHESNCSKANLTVKNSGSHYEKLQPRNITSNCTGSDTQEVPNMRTIHIESNSGSEIQQKPFPNLQNNKDSPVLYFYRINNPNQEEVKKTTPSSVFEQIIAVNDTDPKSISSNDRKNQSALKDDERKTPAPDSLNTLSYQTSTKKPEKVNLDSSTKDTGRTHTKHFSSNKKFFKRSDGGKESLKTSPWELHKLSLGDAAGIQLALKNQNSWVSNLKIAKTSPSVTLPKPTSTQLLARTHSDPTSPLTFVGDFRHPDTLVELLNDYSDLTQPEITDTFINRPQIFWNPCKKIYIPRFTKSYQNKYNFPPKFIIIKSKPWSAKHIFISSNFLRKPNTERKYWEDKVSKRKSMSSSVSVEKCFYSDEEDYGEVGGGSLPGRSKPPESVFESLSAKSNQ